MKGIQLKLEDFLPGYPDFQEEYHEDDNNELFDLYGDEPEKVIYRKKEFYNNRLEPTENKPKNAGGLLKHQTIVAREVSSKTLNDEIAILHGLGSGKCLKKNTKVLLSTGKIKNVQNIKLGDEVMGDDSTPRKVLALTRGRSKMYKITQGNGDPYTVNESHILSLKMSVTKSISPNSKAVQACYWLPDKLKFTSKQFTYNKHGGREESIVKAREFLASLPDIDPKVDIEIKDYLSLPKKIRLHLKGYKAPVIFPKKEVTLNPYYLGFWLGDGNSANQNFTSGDSEIVERIRNIYSDQEIKCIGKSVFHYSIKGLKGSNAVLNQLRNHNLINNKHIPFIYKANSPDIQLQVLAGLIDSDGHYTSSGYYEIMQKSDILSKDIIFLARSLGFQVNHKKVEKTCTNGKDGPVTGIYNRITISGGHVDKIPVILERKKGKTTPNKDWLRYQIQVEEVEEDDYYGISITGNQRFLLGDFTVVHNCIAPESQISIYKDENNNDFKTYTIEELWDHHSKYKEYIHTDDEGGEWALPSEDMYVTSYNTEKKKLVKGCVKSIYRQKINEDLINMQLSNGTSLLCTKRHQIFVDKEWIPAAQLKKGHKAYIFNEEEGKVKKSIIISIENIDYEGYVYDLEIDIYHNYVADGIITHNTCTSIAVSELVKINNPFLKPVLVLVKGGAIKRNFIRELAFKCTKGQYIPDNYNSLTKGEKIARLNKLVSQSYEIRTFEKFAKELTRYSDQYIKSVFSNRVVVIDEVHNIREHLTKKGNKKKATFDLYGILHKFLHIIENRKLVIMSATIMRDRVEEFGSAMNLILPLDKQMPTGKEFMKRFFDGEKLINSKELGAYIRGRVSFLRSMESKVVKYFKGELYKDMKKIPIYINKMHKFQREAYVRAYHMDKGKSGSPEDGEPEEILDASDESGLYDNSRQASLFVFPDGTWGNEGFRYGHDKKEKKESKRKDKDKRENKDDIFTWIEKVGNDFRMTKAFRDAMTDNGKATKPLEIIKIISKYSCIYAKTLKEIIQHPDENTFVYNKYVQGSGAIVFSQLLKLVGFQKSRGYDNPEEDIKEAKKSKKKSKKGKKDDENQEEEKKDNDIDIDIDDDYDLDPEEIGRKPRYSLITGETVSEAEVDRVVDRLFNDKRNKHGEYIQVIVGSQIIGEGKSLMNVRQIHIQTPHWNNSETEQAMARGIRAFSHEDLPEGERFVKAFRHAAVTDNSTESINYLMYKRSEAKEFLIRQIYRICKIWAIDCELFKKRNLLASDEDGTFECDYQTCDYTCANFSKTTMDKPDLISDTYNLFYAEDEIENLTTIVRDLFRKKFSYDLSELLVQLPHTSSMVLIRCLKYIIDKSVQLLNRYGFPCYLREAHNLYFLVDDITLPSSFLLTHYSENPNIKSRIDFEHMIKIAQYKYVEDKIYIFNSIEDPDSNKELIYAQLESMTTDMKELFLEIALLGDQLKEKKKNALRKVILTYFRNYIVSFQNKTVTTLLYDEDQRLRCLSKKADKLDDWKNCPPEVVDEIDEQIVHEKEELSHNEKGKGYYGIISKKNKFQIKFKGRDDSEDGRKKFTGAVCTTIVPKERIINVIEELNINPPQPVIMKKKKDFIDVILKKRKTKNKNARKELEEMDDEQLKSLYFWYAKASKKIMCDTIQQWFVNNDLLMYEK